MNELNELQIKLLKEIKKHPDGISTVQLHKVFGEDSGIVHCLDELKKDKYLTQLESQDDKISKAFQIQNVDFSGDWIITDKGNAFLSNQAIVFNKSLIISIISFFAGVLSALLVEIVVKVFL